MGSNNIPSRFTLQELEPSAGLMGHLAHKQSLPFTVIEEDAKENEQDAKKERVLIQVPWFESILHCRTRFQNIH